MSICKRLAALACLLLAACSNSYQGYGRYTLAYDQDTVTIQGVDYQASRKGDTNGTPTLRKPNIKKPSYLPILSSMRPFI